MTEGQGHNSIAAGELKLLIERVERLAEERSALTADIRDVYAEGKARGYDPRTMREMVRLRKMEKQDREERQALIDSYCRALGLI